MFSFRVGRARPFIGTRNYDQDAASTLQAGLVTYSGDDADQTYQVSYLEWGGRLDHVKDAIDVATGSEAPVRRVADASDTERLYVGSLERNMPKAEATA